MIFNINFLLESTHFVCFFIKKTSKHVHVKFFFLCLLESPPNPSNAAVTLLPKTSKHQKLNAYVANNIGTVTIFIYSKLIF